MTPEESKASCYGQYRVGQFLNLTGEQADDDEKGNLRISPAGAVVELLSNEYSKQQHAVVWHVGCPSTGGNFFMTTQELDEQTR